MRKTLDRWKRLVGPLGFEPRTNGFPKKIYLAGSFSFVLCDVQRLWLLYGSKRTQNGPNPERDFSPAAADSPLSIMSEYAVRNDR